MLEALQSEVISQALRATMLGILPFVALVSAAGLLVSGLLAAMSIREPAACYSARLIVFVLALYYFFPSLASSVVTLAELALR
jgi:type III secretory pathway component EscS